MENNVQDASKKQHSPEFLRKRKFLLVIPILIIPFLTMAFWALGGGKTGSLQTAANANKGLDTTLPMAEFSDKKEKDKMDIYQAAGKDTSAEHQGTQKNFMQTMGFAAINRTMPDDNIAAMPEQSTADEQSVRIEAKLSEINRQLHPKALPTRIDRGYEPEDEETIQNIRKVKRMMRSASGNNHPDPEMQQLSKMLEQLQEIQNPGSVSPAIKIPVSEPKPFKAIPAIVDGKQRVLDGGEVKLKLTDSSRINGYFLPKGQILYGSSQITNQRLLLTIKNIRQDNSIIPVDLTVFSLDGLPGIPAHEAELAGAAGGGADNAIANMQFMTMDQSIGAQAAAGGIQAAKGLFGKKVRKIRVRLQKDYPVLLKDNARKK